MSRLESTLRSWCCLVGVCVGIVASAAAPPAIAAKGPLAQSGPVAAVDDLWEEYPLDPERTDPGAAGSPPSDPPEGTGAEPNPDTRGEAPAGGADPGPAGTPAQAPAESGDGAPVVPILIALGVVGVAGVLAMALARRHGSARVPEIAPAPTPAPANVVEAGHRVYVEGSTPRDGIGDFAGYVHATVVGDEPTADLLCIGDPDGDGALWVRRSEVTAMRAACAETVETHGAPSGRFQRSAGTPSPSARA